MPAALRPYAKAIYPFLLTIVAVLGQWAISGELNRPELVPVPSARCPRS